MDFKSLIRDEELKLKKLLESDEGLSMGERLADKIAEFGGSWTFIISFLAALIFWIVLNVMWLSTQAFDPYPFILLNLILSCIAAEPEPPGGQRPWTLPQRFYGQPQRWTCSWPNK